MAPRRLSVLSVVVGATILGRSALAEEAAPLMVHMTWQRGEGAQTCVDQPALESAVERRLNRRVFVPRAQAGRIVAGEVQRGPGNRGWQVELSLLETTGHILGVRRITIESGPCQDVGADVALVLALMVDLGQLRVAIELPPPAKEPLVARIPPPPVRASAQPRVALSPLTPTFVDLGLSGRIARGLLPGFHAGGGLFVSVSVPDWPAFELDFDSWAPDETTTRGPGARFFGASASMLACIPFRPPRGAWEVSPCAGPQIGLLQVEGVRLVESKNSTQPLVAGVADVRLRLQLADPVWATFGLGAIVPARRDSFTYRAEDGQRPELHRPARFVPAAHVDFSVRLPISS